MHVVPASEPLHVTVDSTGLSIVGKGEWAAAKHGGRGTRGWKKLHLGVDRLGVIVAHALTEATVDDATVGIDPIGVAAGPVAGVTGMAPATGWPTLKPRTARCEGRGPANMDREGVSKQTTIECAIARLPTWQRSTRAREPGRLAGLVREHARHDIAGLADVQRVVGAAEDVDVMHGQDDVASSSTGGNRV